VRIQAFYINGDISVKCLGLEVFAKMLRTCENCHQSLPEDKLATSSSGKLICASCGPGLFRNTDIDETNRGKNYKALTIAIISFFLLAALSNIFYFVLFPLFPVARKNDVVGIFVFLPFTAVLGYAIWYSMDVEKARLSATVKTATTLDKIATEYQQKLLALEQYKSESESRIAAYQYKLENLERELHEARFGFHNSSATSAVKPQRTEEEILYGKLGLTPECTDFVFEAARRAYLKALHPDSFGPAQTQIKREATERFKTTNMLIEKIEKLRSAKKRY